MMNDAYFLDFLIGNHEEMSDRLVAVLRGEKTFNPSTFVIEMARESHDPKNADGFAYRFAIIGMSSKKKEPNPLN